MGYEARAEFLGREVAASWIRSDGFKLYIDGKVVDTTRSYGKGIAFLRGQIIEDDKTHIVEVFWAGNWREFKIPTWVDGKQLDSDE
jgi:hypothetical protein